MTGIARESYVEKMFKKQYKKSVQVSSTAYIEMFKVTCVVSCFSHYLSFSLFLQIP